MVVDRVEFKDVERTLISDLETIFGTKNLLMLHFSSDVLKHFKKK
jgi:hypothetical protein